MADVRTRPGWSVVAPGHRGKGATLRHESGWQVQHCGALAAGELVATTERCVAGIQRIDNVTAGGDRLSPEQIADLEWHAAERARRRGLR